MAVRFSIFVKSIECFHHEEHEEHKDFIEFFMCYLFLSKSFNLHRLHIPCFPVSQLESARVDCDLKTPAFE
jgi:hypothetical protein